MKALAKFLLLGVLGVMETTSAVAAEPASEGVEAESDILKTEALGELQIGARESVVTATLGNKPHKAKEERWEADGSYHQTWSFPEQGITLGMSSDKLKGPKVVESIEAEQRCHLTTKRGVGIGSEDKAVISAYGSAYNKDESSPGESVVIGSLYGGLIFTLKDHRVSRMFIGAAAE